MPENASFYVQGVLAGARRIFSKTITLIESSNPEHQRLAVSYQWRYSYSVVN
jgi:putative protein kinase ArgK-like GTPase of G3E family